MTAILGRQGPAVSWRSHTGREACTTLKILSFQSFLFHNSSFGMASLKALRSGDQTKPKSCGSPGRERGLARGGEKSPCI